MKAFKRTARIFLLAGTALFFAILFCNCFSYRRSIILFEKNILEDNQNVKSVNVLIDEGNWDKKDLRVLISFINGGSLLLESVTEKQDAICMLGCDGYQFLYFSRSVTEPIDPYHSFHPWAGMLGNILDIQLNSINDIIKNYSIISEYVNSLPLIEFEKQDARDHRDTIWETSHKERIIKRDAREYIFFKTPLVESYLEDWYL